MYSLDVILPIVDLQVEKDWGQYVPQMIGLSMILLVG